MAIWNFIKSLRGTTEVISMQSDHCDVEIFRAVNDPFHLVVLHASQHDRGGPVC
jgi:hypothetical protein